MSSRQILARNLKAFRREARVSQEELAHRANLDRTYISALERELYAASIDVLDRIASVLGVSACALIDPETKR
ncbi:helix-turn-helix transcriptional regulator [Gymnodinialimonas sp. 2305UL16-5]|uniref:helix-turn-helix transcriptional regulator n=1 Tax=Gymnodinialimonas mytili TaxID=3126503 RepID=UPI0030B7E20D